ncbi:MAG TPA: HAD hydrolase-like protein [Anaerolineae bacterium]
MTITLRLLEQRLTEIERVIETNEVGILYRRRVYFTPTQVKQMRSEIQRAARGPSPFKREEPNPAYYREMAALLDCAPADCVMVGNEAKNDIWPAKEAGMKTFWVTDTSDPAVPADRRGTLEGFGARLERGEI